MGGALVDSEDTTQLIGETAGGFFEPRRLFFTYFPKVLRKGKSLAGMGGLDQREIRIGEQFRRLIEAYGDDPDALIAEIEANPLGWMSSSETLIWISMAMTLR